MLWGALSTKYNNMPAVASRAYDKNGDGFVVSVGAGVSASDLRIGVPSPTACSFTGSPISGMSFTAIAVGLGIDRLAAGNLAESFLKKSYLVVQPCFGIFTPLHTLLDENRMKK